jgi:hypothetical protein
MADSSRLGPVDPSYSAITAADLISPSINNPVPSRTWSTETTSKSSCQKQDKTGLFSRCLSGVVVFPRFRGRLRMGSVPADEKLHTALNAASSSDGRKPTPETHSIRGAVPPGRPLV